LLAVTFTVADRTGTDDMSLALVQLHASMDEQSRTKKPSTSNLEKVEEERTGKIQWQHLKRARVLPFNKVDILEHSCTFVRGLGALKSGDVTLYMIGDSTMFHQAKGACMAATKHFHTPDGPWSTPGFGKLMQQSPDEFMKAAAGFTEGMHFSCHIPLPKGKLFLGFYASGMPPHDLGALAKMRKIFGGKPDILYFGAGMHMMHMEPQAMVWSPSAINASMNFQDDMQRFLSHPVVKGTPHVVYFKSHSICEERYTGQFQSIVGALKQNPADVANKCAAHVHQEWKMDVSPQQCLDHFMVRENALKMNGKAAAVINGWSGKTGKKVKFVDGYQITDGDQCQHTDITDGRHYMPLVPTELAHLLKEVGFTGSVDSGYVKDAGC